MNLFLVHLARENIEQLALTNGVAQMDNRMLVGYDGSMYNERRSFNGQLVCFPGS